MLLGPSLTLLLGLALGSSAETITAKDQAASAFVDVCLNAQRSGEADLSKLPDSAARLGPNALKSLGYAEADFVVGYNTSDGLVLLDMSRGCAVMSTKGGGRPFLDALLAKSAERGFPLTLEFEGDNPKDSAALTAAYTTPLGGKRYVAVSVTYSKDDVPTGRAGFYASAFRIEKK